MQAGAVAECILDKPTIAKFTIQSLLQKNRKLFTLIYRISWQEKNKTVRIRINLHINENKFAIEIKDIGFGESL